MGARINTIMQTCFFAISGVLPRDEAIQKIKDAIKKTYGKPRARRSSSKNFAAVDQTLANLHEVHGSRQGRPSTIELPPVVREKAPEFVRRVTSRDHGRPRRRLPVSACRSTAPSRPHHPVGEAEHRPRDPGLGRGRLHPVRQVRAGLPARGDPHEGLRPKSHLEAPRRPSNRRLDKGKEFPAFTKLIRSRSRRRTAPAAACASSLPGEEQDRQPSRKAINMGAQAAAARAGARQLRVLPRPPRGRPRQSLNIATVKGSQFLEPLFEYSGACAGCGETPYVKLISQLFGDRMRSIANATGCSSIYGGNLPTTPWAVNADGRGPAWSNSLFEDNAEFGFGFRLTIDKHDGDTLAELVTSWADPDRRRPRDRPARAPSRPTRPDRGAAAAGRRR
jgi:pyruvate-ferredoxin/flavodoxin oxidoreductase